MNKADFKIFENQPNLIYLDNAATTQKPQIVIDSMLDFYQNSNANVHRGIYALSEKATEQYEKARQTVADFISAKQNEIIFTSGTTHSLNLVADSIAQVVINNPGDAIVVSQMEHHSNLIPWQIAAKKHNAELVFSKLTERYELNQKFLHQLFKIYNVKILAITAMSNTLGTIVPLKDIVNFVRKNSPQTIIVVDAAQAIAHQPFNVKELDVDFLAFSGHKMFGPTGIGVLYGKSSLLEVMPPFMTGGGMIQTVEQLNSTWDKPPHKFEAGTPNIAGAIGLAAAINYLSEIGYTQIAAHEQDLSNYLLEQFKKLEQIQLYGPITVRQRGPVFSFNLAKMHAHDLAQILDQDHIAIRAGHHCTQILMREVLKVPATARVSLSIYNTKQDIDLLITALKKATHFFEK